MLSWLLLLPLLGATPDKPAPAPAAFHWRVPGLVAQVEVPGEMKVDGIPIRLEVYTSRESIENLLQSFATAFDEAGYYIQPRPPRVLRQPHLTALDTRTLTAYTVILEPAGSGLTTVVLGQAKMGDVQRPPPGESPLPLYPGATNVLQGDFEGARTLTYRAPTPEASLRAWYREQLGKAGYKEEEPQLFRRDTRQVRLSLRPDGGGTSVLLFLETASPSSAQTPGP
ncbi:hypothetical protein [Melittangium boletus]|uniref:Uncharacterized protein n=1 Tax=Melittangium boletus DSM 14713 TaxID=1294270 RepID=A0A250IMI4_9BACT|nr:hypothetical protein [Melittangium boletus]ATB32156.1 hypothetical protein MEBOL_005632 [Melittangium boletus DSM 14713]